MTYSFTQLLWLFFLYGFAGWCVEVIFHAASMGKFVNRGFLIGPICPIYGYGLVAVILLLAPVQDKVFLVYFGSVIICSVFELIVGWVSEKFMHTRLWDYSDNAFNIGGYVCLGFSLLWGVGCLCILYIFHPMVMKLVMLIQSIPHTHGNVMLGILSAMLLADLGITGFNALKLDAHMRAIDTRSPRLSKGCPTASATSSPTARSRPRSAMRTPVRTQPSCERSCALCLRRRTSSTAICSPHSRA